ncbi:hypothetical protein [Streptomyces antarcticus]|nr:MULTISPECIES: hypothetical protein [unclassified Streptomyces]MCY0946709.1 hypothetical protein [Streptomyces sp. H34-AA3]MCY0953401.1 hypothetical protein [Streptomyces sp. H27-S2]MCZ4085151.1 hypothetical protein [Streptomyces sp. H34-S5]
MLDATREPFPRLSALQNESTSLRALTEEDDDYRVVVRHFEDRPV